MDNSQGKIGFVWDSSNLYSEPNADSAMVGCVLNGEQVVAYPDESLNDWLYVVNAYGVFGYCNRAAISLTNGM